MDDAGAQERPVLRVVSGNPTPEEIAALVAVVTAAAAGSAGSGTPAGPPTEWTDKARLMRRPLSPGPHAWWASGLPS